MSRSRLRGSFSRHEASNRRTFAGTAPKSGSLVSTDAIASDPVAPPNNCLPVSISHNTTPNAQISARLSTTCPRACSGAMYPAVPITRPGCVLVRVVAFGSGVAAPIFASPKSSTFTTPCGVTLIFAGFRSRCVIPFSCAASNASAICPA